MRKVNEVNSHEVNEYKRSNTHLCLIIIVEEKNILQFTHLYYIRDK